MPVERDLFVEIMASYPAGVAVVTTLDRDGTPRGLTTTAVSSVSAEPPQVLASIYHGMGINLDATMMPGPGERPVRLVEAEPIRQLFV